jgi:hypothetical protein
MKKILVAISLVCMLSLSAMSAELFHVDIGTGSFKDRVTGTLPTNTGVVMAVTEKGTAGRWGATDDLDDYGIVSGVKTIALIIRPTGDTKLLQDNGADVLEISGGVYVASSMTATYVNNVSSTTALSGVWQIVIAEFSGGVSFSTDLEIDVTASSDIAAVFCYDAASSALRAELYQELLRRTNISKSMVTNALSPVALFDGNSNTVQLFKNDLNTVSLSIWVNTQDAGSSFRVLIRQEQYQSLFMQDNELGYYDWSVPEWKGTGQSINDGIWHHCFLTSQDGVANGTKVYLDNNLVYTGILTLQSSTAKWSISSNIAQSFKGRMFRGELWNRILTEEERTQVYRQQNVDLGLQFRYRLDESSGTVAYNETGTNNGTYIGLQPHGQSHKDMIVSWSASDHLRADGRTVATGDLDGLHVASGSFQAKENASGTFVECLTDGTLQIQGVNLSEFIGNGWIQSLGGSLSAEAGQTVDDATNVSFTDNTLSIALTAGQIFSGIVITPN